MNIIRSYYSPPLIFGLVLLGVSFFSIAYWNIGANHSTIGSAIAEIVFPIDIRLKHNFESCGWDGVRYCGLFYGELVDAPFSRRTLGPLIASFFSLDPIVGFSILNVLSIFTALLFSAKLILMEPSILKEDKLNKFGVIFSIFAMIFLNRNSLHLMSILPVTIDLLSLAFILAGAYSVIKWSNGNLIYLFFLIIFLASQAKEHLSIPLVVAYFSVTANIKVNLKSTIVIFLALISILVAFSRQSSEFYIGMSQMKIWDVMYWSFNFFFTTFEKLLRLITMLLLSLGFFPLLFFIKSMRKFSVGDRQLLMVILVLLGISILGGTDIDRIFFPIGILLAILAGRRVLSPDGSQRIIYLYLSIVLAYVVAQSPWEIIIPSSHVQILNYYGLAYDFTSMEYVLRFGIYPIAYGVAAGAFFFYFTRKLLPA